MYLYALFCTYQKSRIGGLLNFNDTLLSYRYIRYKLSQSSEIIVLGIMDKSLEEVQNRFNQPLTPLNYIIITIFNKPAIFGITLVIGT